MGAQYNVNLLRVYDDEAEYSVWEDLHFEAGQNIVVQGTGEHVAALAETFDLELTEETEKTAKSSDRGYLEVVIPARSDLTGKTAHV